MSNNKVALEKVRIAYPNLLEKEPLGAFCKTEDRRYYNTVILLDKTNPSHMKSLKEIVSLEKALLKSAKIAKNKHPIAADGDAFLAEYDVGQNPDLDPETAAEIVKKNLFKKGHIVLRAKSKFEPELSVRGSGKYDKEKHQDLFYSGCYVHLYVQLYDYDNDFGKGVSIRLLAAEFVKHGEKIKGAGNSGADKAFATFVDDEEDGFDPVVFGTEIDNSADSVNLF